MFVFASVQLKLALRQVTSGMFIHSQWVGPSIPITIMQSRCYYLHMPKVETEGREKLAALPKTHTTVKWVQTQEVKCAFFFFNSIYVILPRSCVFVFFYHRKGSSLDGAEAVSLGACPSLETHLSLSVG